MADSIGIGSLLGEGTMPAAYSADIRGRVIASVESGSSRREAAETLMSVRVQRSNG